MSRTSSDLLNHIIDRSSLSDPINNTDHVDPGLTDADFGAGNQYILRNSIEFTQNIEGHPRMHPWEVNPEPQLNDPDYDDLLRPFHHLSRDTFGSLYPYDHYSPRGSILIVDKEDMCPICYQTKTLKSFGMCRDYFCEDCLRDFFVSELSNFSKASMKCPICQGPFMAGLPAFLLSAEQMQKFNRLIKIFELIESEKMFQWCPAAKCEGYAIATRENFNVVCNICSLKFCFNCMKPWHNRHCGTRRGLTYSLWAFTHNVKKCPKCKSQTQKNGGCFHMTCQSCKYEYCWTCGDQYKSNHKKSFCYFGRSIFELNCWFIFVLMVFPVVFPFIFVILYDYVIQTEGINANDRHFLIRVLKNRCFMMFFLFVMGPFFIALLWLLFILVLLFWLLEKNIGQV